MKELSRVGGNSNDTSEPKRRRELLFSRESTADNASLDTSAQIGNLADAMRDSVVILPNTWFAENPLRVQHAPLDA